MKGFGTVDPKAAESFRRAHIAAVGQGKTPAFWILGRDVACFVHGPLRHRITELPLHSIPELLGLRPCAGSCDFLVLHSTADAYSVWDTEVGTLAFRGFFI